MSRTGRRIALTLAFILAFELGMVAGLWLTRPIAIGGPKRAVGSTLVGDLGQFNQGPSCQMSWVLCWEKT